MEMHNKEEEILEESPENEEQGDEKTSRKDNKLLKKIAKLEVDLDKANADRDHWKNEYYRAYADTKNLRDSIEKDHRQALKYRLEGAIDSLLPVLDSFHMALINEPTDPALKNYLIGFQFIYRNLVSALENEGVKEIAPNNGDKFDSATMNAVDTVETDGEENVIQKVYAKGYMLHDRIVRPANVCVSIKKKEEVTENKNEEKSDA